VCRLLGLGDFEEESEGADDENGTEEEDPPSQE
jgi:hypothetical protein